jgi:hypothetical protein
VTAAGWSRWPATTLRHRRQLQAGAAAGTACRHHTTAQGHAGRLHVISHLLLNKTALTPRVCAVLAGLADSMCSVYFKQLLRDHCYCAVCTLSTFSSARLTFSMCCYKGAWLSWAAADVPHFLWVHPTGLCYQLVMSRVILKQANLLTTDHASQQYS